MEVTKELTIRPFSSREDYEAMIDYFLLAEDSFLRGMGVDRERVPKRADWLHEVLVDHKRPDDRKDRFYLAWIYNGQQVGHSSLNKIKLGEEAYVHLHLWRTDLRKAGLGTEFFKRSIDFYFEKFCLKRIVCEPYAENPAPNWILLKLGFKLIKRYRTVPGTINYEQEVNRYELTRHPDDSVQ